METGYRDAMIRSRGGQVLAVVVVAAGLVPVVSAAVDGGLGAALRTLPVVGLLGFGAIAVFWMPAVGMDPAGVELRNVLRTTRISWPAIEDVETRWSLTLVTQRGRFSAWAAPRGSAIAAGRETRRELRAARVGATSPRELASAGGSLAATLITRQWAEYRDAGLLGRVEGDGVEQRWHVRTAAALVVLTVLSAVALIAR